MTPLRLRNLGHESATSQTIKPTDFTKSELPPPVVTVDEPLPDQSSSPLTEAKKETSEMASLLQYWEKQSFRSEESSIYEDALEHISDDDGAVEDDTEELCTLPVQVYTNQRKPPRRGSQQTHHNSISSQWLHDYPLSGGYLPRQRSIKTADSACWSVCTVYTWENGSDCSSETTLVSHVSQEGKRETYSHSECPPSKSSTLSSLRDLGPDTRSRTEIFAKGVPWGLHGQDYLPPLLKCHSLRETMRRETVKSEHMVPYLIVKIKNLFRKHKRWGE
jgi:hypothetical protein